MNFLPDIIVCCWALLIIMTIILPLIMLIIYLCFKILKKMIGIKHIDNVTKT